MVDKRENVLILSPFVYNRSRALVIWSYHVFTPVLLLFYSCFTDYLLKKPRLLLFYAYFTPILLLFYSILVGKIKTIKKRTSIGAYDEK